MAQSQCQAHSMHVAECIARTATCNTSTHLQCCFHHFLTQRRFVIDVLAIFPMDYIVLASKVLLLDHFDMAPSCMQAAFAEGVLV